VHLGFKDNYNLLCLLLKSPGIDVLEELFVWILPTVDICEIVSVTHL
jgi:hypothetical protein